MRFVGEGGLGPEEQFRLVLQLPNKLTSNPWSHLDKLYAIIRGQAPKDILLLISTLNSCYSLLLIAVDIIWLLLASFVSRYRLTVLH